MFVPLAREGWLQKLVASPAHPFGQWRVLWVELLEDGKLSWFDSPRKRRSEFRSPPHTCCPPPFSLPHTPGPSFPYTHTQLTFAASTTTTAASSTTTIAVRLSFRIPALVLHAALHSRNENQGSSGLVARGKA